MTKPMRIDPVAVSSEVSRYRNLKEQLLAMCPDLSEDEEALFDTLDGETTLDEVLAEMARVAKRRAAMAKAMDEIIKGNQARKAAHKKAHDTLKKTILDALLAVGKKKFSAPDVSASWRDLDDQIEVVMEVEMIPDEYVTIEQVRKPNLEKLAADREKAVEMGLIVIHDDRKSLTIR